MKYTALLLIVFIACCQPSKKSITTTSENFYNVAYPFPVKTVQLSNDVEIAYMDEGQGEYTLLMLHGLGSYAPAWNKNILQLRRRHRCIAVDLPNYGRSSKGDYPSTMSFFARVVEEFIDRLELKNVVLIGHSMGAQVAMTAILNTDPAIEKLILVAPAGFETFSEQNKLWFRQFVTPATIKATPTERIQTNFNLNFYGNQTPDDARFMYEDRLGLIERQEDFEYYCNAIPKSVMSMLEEPVFDRLPEIRTPTLILFGKEDVLIPNKFMHPTLTTEAVAQAGHNRLPNSKMRLLSPCGHFLQWQCAGQVNQEILTFLK